MTLCAYLSQVQCRRPTCK